MDKNDNSTTINDIQPLPLGLIPIEEMIDVLILLKADGTLKHVTTLSGDKLINIHLHREGGRS